MSIKIKFYMPNINRDPLNIFKNKIVFINKLNFDFDKDLRLDSGFLNSKRLSRIPQKTLISTNYLSLFKRK